MKKSKINYGIIGLGRFGLALAKKLATMGADVLVVDKDESKVIEMRDYTENAIIANALDKKTLEDIGFQNCDIVIVAISGHIDVSILTVMKLQAMGVKRIVAKAKSEEHGEILKKLGVEIVFPEGLKASGQSITLMDALFQSTSAFGTVGLTTGITPYLSVGSKIVSIIIMYIGRLGPLTIATLWYFSNGDRFRYPEGNIAIG